MKRVFIVLWILVMSGVFGTAQDHNENEVGFVFSSTNFPGNREAGIGGRFLHNYNSVFGFEFQGSFYPVNESVNFYQGSFNFKGTYRMEERHKVNFFGVVGPGFIIADPKLGKNSTDFGLTAGGGLEFVPHPNVVIRADFANFIIFSDGDSFNNFDFKLGLMYRW